MTWIDPGALEPLRSIGLSPAVLRHLLPQLSPEPERPLVRLVRADRASVRLHDGRQEHLARVHPALAHALEAQAEALAVGDWCRASADAHGHWWLQERLEPLATLARRDGDGRRHVLASNVDVALLVMGLADGDFQPRRLERYLAIVAEAGGVVPVLVLSKADRLDAAEREARLAALRARLGEAVPPCVALDARSPAALDALAPWLVAGTTLVVLGSSGAGKSTLANTLAGAALQATQSVRASDGRGQHTTTARSLLPLPGGACLIDTPGLRTLQPDAEAGRIAASFVDIEALSSGCRFRDCRHRGEPGCAVQTHVDADRLANFHKLLRDARREAMGPLERRAQRAAWKARGREGQLRARAKRGFDG